MTESSLDGGDKQGFGGSKKEQKMWKRKDDIQDNSSTLLQKASSQQMPQFKEKKGDRLPKGQFQKNQTSGSGGKQFVSEEYEEFKTI